MEGISNLDYPKKNLSLYWLLNNSIDKSEEILRGFSGEYRGIRINTHNFDDNPPLDKRVGDIRKNYTCPHLAVLRNIIIDKFKKDKDAQYLLMLDTDTIVEPLLLKHLLKAKKDILTVLLDVDFEKGVLYNIFRLDKESNEMIRWTKKEIQNADGLFQVDIFGGGLLFIGKNMTNIKFENHDFGEFIGYSLNAIGKKAKIWCLKEPILATHKMD